MISFMMLANIAVFAVVGGLWCGGWRLLKIHVFVNLENGFLGIAKKHTQVQNCDFSRPRQAAENRSKCPKKAKGDGFGDGLVTGFRFKKKISGLSPRVRARSREKHGKPVTNPSPGQTRHLFGFQRGAL